MRNYKLFRTLAICTLSALLTIQTPLAVLADGEVPDNPVEITEEITTPEITPELPATPQDPSVTPEAGPQEGNPEQPADPDSQETPDNQEKEETKEEIKEALPITSAISVSGEAGNLTLVLNVTNASFLYENIPDFSAVFAGIPAGVSVDVAGQTENSITYHIHGNAAGYTKNDLVMAIPANWLKDTADKMVETETKIEGHDYVWFAHADFGIRLKSKAEIMDNATYIAHQNLTVKQKDYDTIRFVYKKMDLKIFTGKADILEYPAEDARVVGQAEKDQTLYEIIGIQGGWVYIESGKVRGFVKREQITTSAKNLRYRRKLPAKELIPASDNKAYDYVRITGNNPLVKEDPRITKTSLEIKEDSKSDSRTIGTIGENGILYWLSYENDGWMYVESGDVRGFVQESDLLSLKDSQDRIAQKGAEAFSHAEITVEPKENKALYDKMISTKPGDMEGILRDQIVDLARAYIGNPYVYGGTDPVHGIDCSAFMQFLFGNYGISLPRTSKSQGFTGLMVTMDSLEKGDMIMYADDAEIYHVVLYAGDGKTVEAADEKQGLLSKDVNTVAAVWGISLLDGADGKAMPAEIAKPAWDYQRRVQ